MITDSGISLISISLIQHNLIDHIENYHMVLGHGTNFRVLSFSEYYYPDIKVFDSIIIEGTVRDNGPYYFIDTFSTTYPGADYGPYTISECANGS